MSWPGVIRSRSSSKVCANCDRVCSASRSSCALLVMEGPRLLFGDGYVASNLMDGPVGHEVLGPQPAHSDQKQDQPDQQDYAADQQLRPWLRQNVIVDER